MPTPTPREFIIPVDLLKSFQRDIRFVPQVPHNNGYIIFDMDMLISVLKRGDAKASAALAEGMEALKKNQAQLVIMQKAAV